MTTNWLTKRAHAVIIRQIVAAYVVEAQEERMVIVWRSRPIIASEPDIVQISATGAAKARSRIPDSRGGTEHAGEVYTFIGIVVR